MRVELIDQIPNDLFARRLTLPRRGLPIIGTIIKDSGHDVRISYEGVQSIDWSEVAKADLVGFSVLTSHARQSYAFAQKIKVEANGGGKKVRVVMGGPHVTALPEEALRHGADFVVRHEAEDIIAPLLTALEEPDREALEKIPNLSWRTETGEIVHNPVSPQRADLNKYPIPDFSLIRGWKRPGRFSILRYSYYPIESSRGCIYKCQFCYSPEMFPGKPTYIDKELVVDEIEQQIQQGHNRFIFVDDNLLLNPKRVYELLELMLSRGLKCEAWTAQLGIKAIIAAEKQAPGIFRLMQLTGVGRQFVAIESINPETLSKNYKKPQNLDEIEEAISILSRHRIPIHAMFVLGGDNDTLETFKATAEFALAHDIKTISATILTPLPGTPIFREFRDEGRILTEEQDYPSSWEHYDMYHPVFKPQNMTPEQLREQTIGVLKRFYRIPRIMKDVGNLEEFLGKMYVHYRLIPRFPD